MTSGTRQESPRRARPDLGALTDAAAVWREAASALEVAERARARAVVDALGAGASLRMVGDALGVSHVRALQLSRWAAGLAPDEVTPAPRPESPHPVPVVADPGRPCLREGCPLRAEAGARFCAGHRWS